MNVMTETPLRRTVMGASVLPEVGTWDEVIESAGWDYEVEKVPAFQQITVPCPACDGLGFEIGMGGEPCSNCSGDSYADEFRLADDSFLVRRTDNHRVLGLVGNKYKVHQNRHALHSIEPLLQSGVATVEAGGTIEGGKQIWAMLQFDEQQIMERTNGVVEGIMGDEGVKPYGLVLIDHSAQRSNMLITMSVRLACSNMLAGLRARHGKIRHVGNVEEKWEKRADKLYTEYVSNFEEFAYAANMLRQFELSESEFAHLVLDSVAKLGEKPGLEASGRELAAFERRVERREIVRSLWTSGAGHSGDRSAWEAYNGAVEAMDHSDLWRSRVKLTADLGGSRTTQKRKLLQKLVSYAKQN